MLWTPANTTHNVTVDSAPGQPTSTNWGAAVTADASANTKGAWVELISDTAVTTDIYALRIQVNGAVATNGTSPAMLLDIGFDPNGGTSYATHLSNLVIGNTFSLTANGSGSWIYMPCRIPAGSAIAARLQAAVGSRVVYVSAVAFGGFSHDEALPKANYFENINVDATTSSGTTSLTPGAASEGSWVEIGTASQNLWYVWPSLTTTDTAFGSGIINVDIAIGDATNKKVIITDQMFQTTNTELIATTAASAGHFSFIPANTKIYARAQESTALSMSPMYVTLNCVGG